MLCEVYINLVTEAYAEGDSSRYIPIEKAKYTEQQFWHTEQVASMLQLKNKKKYEESHDKTHLHLRKTRYFEGSGDDNYHQIDAEMDN